MKTIINLNSKKAISKRKDIMKTLTLLIFLFIFNIINLKPSYSQVNESWVVNSTATLPRGMVRDNQGNIYVIGQGNIVTLKYSAEGTFLWSATYNGGGYSAANSMENRIKLRLCDN
jgi:hypothetical protein